MSDLIFEQGKGFREFSEEEEVGYKVSTGTPKGYEKDEDYSESFDPKALDDSFEVYRGESTVWPFYVVYGNFKLAQHIFVKDEGTLFALRLHLIPVIGVERLMNRLDDMLADLLEAAAKK